MLFPIYTDARMEWTMERLSARRPELVAELALLGPMEEPFCGVCVSLLPEVLVRAPGWRLILDVLMYHDEAMYEVAEEDYMRAIGLAGVFTYQRCLKVYETAKKHCERDVQMASGGAAGQVAPRA